jgi:Protein of unknown function (DUF2530)
VTEQDPGPRPPQLAPLDVDGVGAVVMGTVLWAVALVVLLVLRPSLEASDSQWWIWVALTGTLLGIPGLAYTTRRRAAYRRARRES